MYRTRIRKIEVIGLANDEAVVHYQIEKEFNNMDDAIRFAKKLEDKY